MPLLPRRFEKIKNVLNHRMSDLTVLLENIEKPHNLSAILRTCDAVGVLEANAISNEEKSPTFNSTAQGSQKWIKVRNHENIDIAVKELKSRGFTLYGTYLDSNSYDYRECDFTTPSAFVLGAEKWGLSEASRSLMDKSIFIPMQGMVQSLNVSVAAATLLFEAVRQRKIKGTIPRNGEGIEKNMYEKILFEWSYPDVADWCKIEEREYPKLNHIGEIIENLPRDIKLHY